MAAPEISIWVSRIHSTNIFSSTPYLKTDEQELITEEVNEAGN